MRCLRMSETENPENELNRLERRLQGLNDETTRLDARLKELQDESDRLEAQRRSATESRMLLDSKSEEPAP